MVSSVVSYGWSRLLINIITRIELYGREYLALFLARLAETTIVRSLCTEVDESLRFPLLFSSKVALNPLFFCF